MYHTYYDHERGELYTNDPAIEDEQSLRHHSDNFINESYKTLAAIQAKGVDEYALCDIEDIKEQGEEYLTHEDWLTDSEYLEDYALDYKILLEVINLILSNQPVELRFYDNGQIITPGEWSYKRGFDKYGDPKLRASFHFNGKCFYKG